MAKEWWIGSRGNRLHGVRPCRYLPFGKPLFWVYWGKWKFLLTARPYRGICVVARGPRNDVGSRHGQGWLHWEYPSMKRKNAPSGEGAGKHLAALETDLFSDLMPLVEHCALTQYDDAGARETGWLTIKTQGAAWVVQIKDPDSGMSFTSVAETLDKALQTAALLLSCDEAPWSPDQWLKSKKKK